MMQTDTISELGFIAEGGEMGAMIRQKDWTQTSLGAPQHWPNCLKFAVSLMLRSGYPMFLWWGTDHIMLHNDAYLPVLGKKHPDALGSRAAETWSEIWPDIGPLAARVFNGENVYLQDLPLYMQRKGFLEETYWTFSYSPIITDEGEVGGLFCACNEETGKIYGQRRLSILQQITSLGIRSGSPADTAGAAIDILATNNHDIPFAAVFLQDESGRLELAGQTGSGAGGESIDAHIWNTWGIEACKGGAPRVLHNLPFRFTQSPSSNNEMTITKAMVLPMQQNGFLICGIAPSIEWNETYENYLLTISGQVAFVLNSIKAFENERMRAEAMLQLARSKDKAEQELHNLFMQAPFGIIILEGKDFVIRLANDAYLPIVQRKTEELVGKPVFEAVPEVGGQGFEEVLEGVMTTGRPYFHNEVQTTIHRNGREEATYLNIVYQPLRELDGPVTKIMILINEVTDQVLARKKWKSSHRYWSVRLLTAQKT